MVDKEIAENMINESQYLQGLYELFKLIDGLVDGEFDDNVDLLRRLEDSVYTINNSVLTEQEKLSLEITRIIGVNEKNTDLKSKEIISKKIQNNLDIMSNVFDKSIDENYILDSVRKNFLAVKKDAIFSMKKRIAIIESELNIPISFFEAGINAFLDIYKKYYNAYKKDNLSEKRIGEKYEYI